MIVAELLGWCVVVAGSITVVVQFVGTPTRSISIVQALTPWMLPPVVAVAVGAAWSDRTTLGFAAAVVGLAVCVIGLPLVLAGRGPEPVGDARLTVMTANVLYTNGRIGEVADAIERADPDVIAINEITPEIERALRSHPVAARYPHRRDEPADLAAGLSIWSKHPLGTADDIAELRRGIDTTADTPVGRIRIIAVHPPPPVFDLATWSDQLDALPTITSRSDLPTIVLGDFNASWFHPPFRQMVSAAGLRDAAAADGRGLSMTWPTDRWLPAFVTLDHVLVDDRWAVIDTTTIHLPGSDHAGVLAELGAASSSGGASDRGQRDEQAAERPPPV